jgi:hypothetical protein
MAKKPTLQNLNKEAKKLDSKRSVTIKDFEFILDEHFRTTKIQKMLMDYVEFINEIKQQGAKLDTSSLIIYLSLLVNGLVLKYFSNIPFKENESHETLVATVNNLIDLEIFEELWNSFNESELTKVNDILRKVSENAPQTSQMIGDLLAQVGIQDLIENDNNETSDIDA